MTSVAAMPGWHEWRLRELITIKHGFAFKGEFFSAAGPYVLLTPGNFNEEGGFRLKGEKEKYYTGPVPVDYVLKRGDLLVAMTEQGEGLLGSPAIIPEDDRYLHNQRLGLVCPKEAGTVDLGFLYYLFNSASVRSQIRATANGAKVRHTSPSRIGEVTARLPPLARQRAIAGILSVYDELIENNTGRIQILEEMARLIYREWFVQFRFPGHETVRMVDSELGRVPEGWKVEALTEVAEVVMGQSPSSQFYNQIGDGLPFHQGVTYFGRWFPVNRIFCAVCGRTAEEGDILLSVRAPVGRINVANARIVIGRGLSAIRSKQGNQAFLLYQLKDQFREEDSMGNGAIFKAVTGQDLRAIRVIVPPRELVEVFQTVVSPILAEIRNLTDRDSNCQQTRDLLLPRLISGEIGLETAEVSSDGEAVGVG